MQTITLSINLKTDRYLLYFDEDTKKYYLIDKEEEDYLYIAKKNEMQTRNRTTFQFREISCL